MISNHIWELRGYLITLSIYSLNYYINRYRLDKEQEYIYNRYISKSLASINSRNKLIKNNFMYHSMIYYLLYNWKYNWTNEINEFIIQLINENPKEIEKYRKIFEDIYNCKLNLKLL